MVCRWLGSWDWARGPRLDCRTGLITYLNINSGTTHPEYERRAPLSEDDLVADLQTSPAFGLNINEDWMGLWGGGGDLTADQSQGQRDIPYQRCIHI